MDGIPYVTAVQSTDDHPPPADDEVLQLHDLQESDTGWYSCRIRNSNIMTTYVTASLGGVVALALIMFSLYIFFKYRCVHISSFQHIVNVIFRIERSMKKQAIDNAHR